MATKGRHTTIEAAGKEVRLSNPDKVFFEQAGHTKLDLANHYLEVADAALVHLRERPTTLKRFVDGAGGEFFFKSESLKERRSGFRPPPCTSRAGAARASCAPTTPPISSGR